MLNLQLLISGAGSNAQAIMQACQQPQGSLSRTCRVQQLISNRVDAGGLAKATANNILANVVVSKTTSQALFEAKLLEQLNRAPMDILVLAGFMKILSAQFIEQCPCPILNIHPSLLPAYKGLDTYRRALADQQAYHGVSVHLVTAELDDGPILAQIQLAINPDDTVDSLKTRVQRLEHWLYPKCLHLIGSGQIQLTKATVEFMSNDFQNTTSARTFLWQEQDILNGALPA